MVGYDPRKGYFLACGRGNVSHSGHCKDLYWASHPPSSLVDNTIVQRMLGLRQSHAALSISESLFHKSTGTVLSRAKIRFITHGSDSALSVDDKTYNDPKDLITFFRSNGISYVALLNGRIPYYLI